MFKNALLTCLMFGACALPAYAADETCTPKSEKPAELIRAINCLQKRVIALESANSSVVRIGEPIKLGFDSARCLAPPSGVGGNVAGLNPPIPGQLLTLLQDCGGSPPMALRR
jgi:hypothetical protein